MKRLAFLLTILLLLVPLGCAADEGEAADTAVFYYPRTEIAYHSHEGLIAGETRARGEQSLEALLRDYLRGPTDEALRAPFPAGTALVEVSFSADTVLLVLDVPASSLSSLGKTVAYACLAKTVLGLTQADAVSIQTQAELESGEAPVVMRADSLVLTDEIPLPDETEQGE